MTDEIINKKVDGSKDASGSASDMQGNSRLSGLGALITGGLVNQGLGSLRLLIFAPLLGQAGFGALRLGLTASAILSSVSGLGLYTCYSRYLPETKDRQQASAFIKKTLGWILFPTIFIAVALSFFSDVSSKIIFADKNLAVFAALIAVSLPVIVIHKSLLGIACGLGDFKASAIGETIQNFIFFFLGLIFLIYFNKSSATVFGTFVIGMILASVWLYFKLPIDLTKRAKDDEINLLFARAVKYSIWYSMIPLLQFLFDFMDRWMLAHYYDLQTTGAYSIVPIIAGGMTLICRSLTPIVIRRGSVTMAKFNNKSHENFLWGAISIAIVGSMIYSAILYLTEPAIWMIIGAKWKSDPMILSMFLIYFTLFNAYYLIGCVASFEEKTWVNLLALILGSSANIILNILWVKPYGMLGAAGATLSGQIVLLLVHVVFVLSRGIKIAGRVKLAAVLPAALLLPKILFIFIVFIVVILSIKTNLFLNDSDRRMVWVWLKNIKRRERKRRCRR